MRLLLDTNVISEPLKRSPNSQVIDWLNRQAPLDLYLSVLTLGELTMGFELAPPGRRRDALQAWVIQDVVRHFVGRLLHVDETVARNGGACRPRAAALVASCPQWTGCCSRPQEFTNSRSRHGTNATAPGVACSS